MDANGRPWRTALAAVITVQCADRNKLTSNGRKHVERPPPQGDGSDQESLVFFVGVFCMEVRFAAASRLVWAS